MSARRIGCRIRARATWTSFVCPRPPSSADRTSAGRRRIFAQLSEGRPGRLSVADICQALGSAVDARALREELPNGELSYNDLRWLLAALAPRGPPAVLGADGGVERRWRVSTHCAKRASDVTDAWRAARQENATWRLMWMARRSSRPARQPEPSPDGAAPPAKPLGADVVEDLAQHGRRRGVGQGGPWNHVFRIAPRSTLSPKHTQMPPGAS